MKYYGSIMGNHSVFGLTHEHALALLIKQINKKKSILNIIYKCTLNFVYGFMLFKLSHKFDI